MGASIFPGSVDVLTKAMTFLEERHKIITDNIANAGTPFYKTKSAPVAEFQQALSRAIEDHRMHPDRALTLGRTQHTSDGESGLVVTPVDSGGGDGRLMRHDQNNVDLETQMSDLAQNTLMHKVMADLLRKQFQMLQSAISGNPGG